MQLASSCSEQVAYRRPGWQNPHWRQVPTETIQSTLGIYGIKCHPARRVSPQLRADQRRLLVSKDQGGGSNRFCVQMALKALSVLLVACLASAVAPMSAAASIPRMCGSVPGDLSLAFVKDTKNQQAVRHDTPFPPPRWPPCVGLFLTSCQLPFPLMPCVFCLRACARTYFGLLPTHYST